MKRLMLAVWCLGLWTLFLCHASAESALIRERVGAPKRLTTSFASSSGRLTFLIDADVEVPDARAVHVYEVSPVPVPAERARALADALMGSEVMGNSEYVPDTLFDPLDGETS